MTFNVFRLAWVNDLRGHSVNDLFHSLGKIKWPPRVQSSVHFQSWFNFIQLRYESSLWFRSWFQSLNLKHALLSIHSDSSFKPWFCFVYFLVHAFAIFRMTWHWKLTWWLFISFICSCNLAFEINPSTHLFQDVSSRTVSYAPAIRAVPWPLWSSYVLRPWSSLLSHGS